MQEGGGRRLFEEFLRREYCGMSCMKIRRHQEIGEKGDVLRRQHYLEYPLLALMQVVSMCGRSKLIMRSHV